MHRSSRRHTSAAEAERADVTQRALTRRSQSDMVPSLGSYPAENRYDPRQALAQGLYQGGSMDPSSEASHTSNIAGIGNMQDSSIVSKQVYRPTVVHKNEDRQDHSSTITKHKSKTRSTNHTQVVVNVQNVYYQGPSNSGLPVMPGISSLEHILSPEILSAGNQVDQLMRTNNHSTNATMPSTRESPSSLQGTFERKSSKDPYSAHCRLQMMLAVNRQEPIILNMVLVEGVVFVGAVIAVVSDSGCNKIGIIESLDMDGRLYQELDKMSITSSNGIDVKIKTMPGKRAAVYQKDYFPGDEFQCFLKGYSPTRQQGEGMPGPSRDAIAHNSSNTDIQAISSQSRHGRHERSKQSIGSIPIISDDTIAELPLRTVELPSRPQPPKHSRRHDRREGSKHDGVFIPITSSETPAEAPIGLTPPKSKRQPSERSTHILDEAPGRQKNRETIDSPPSHVRPSRGILQVFKIFRKDPLVLGVHLMDGVLMEGMLLYPALPSTPSGDAIGTIISLQIHQTAYQRIKLSTPDVSYGVGMGVQLSLNGSWSYMATNIPVGTTLHCYQVDGRNINQGPLPEAEHLHHTELNGAPANSSDLEHHQGTSMPAIQCSIQVFKVFRTIPLILGVILLSGRMKRGMVVVKLQGTSNQTYSIIGTIESLEIKHTSYNVVDHNIPGIAEGIGVRLCSTEDAVVSTRDSDLMPNDQLYCLKHSDVVAAPTISRNASAASTMGHPRSAASPCSVRISDIFKNDPLILGVSLLCGKLHVGMVVTTPKGPHSPSQVLGRIGSLQINRCFSQMVDEHTPGIQAGIGMLIEPPTLSPPLVSGRHYTVNSDLHCFMEADYISLQSAFV